MAIDIAGPDHPEGEGLDEDPADQVLAIAAALDADGPAEHVGEEQDEHQRLQGDVEQLLGELADVLDPPAGEHDRLADAASRAGRRRLAVSGEVGAVRVAVMWGSQRGRARTR